MNFEALIDRLNSEGEAVLQELVDDGAEESLYLEFKIFEDQKNQNLSKNDRRMLGKAISGFGNAEGGVLIIGVSTDAGGEVDYASTLCPIAGFQKIVNKVKSYLPEVVIPEVHGSTAFGIPARSKRSSGYLVVYVPRSQNRPHMSLAPDDRRYYRRGTGRTRSLIHGEVRDLMLAGRESVLTLTPTVVHTGTHGEDELTFQLELRLDNVSLVTARNPYLRVTLPEDAAYHVRNLLIPEIAFRKSNIGESIFNSVPGSLIHAKDYLVFCGIEFIAIPATHLMGERNNKPVFKLDRARVGDPELWRIGIRRSGSPGKFELFKQIETDIWYGAENAILRETKLALGKPDLVAMFADVATETLAKKHGR